ncbi:MAG: hypothetical protein PHG35_02460 [Dehalococcoidales bacterium]|nr:hypothetical protein [Dehalococcoidales bacterium]
MSGKYDKYVSNPPHLRMQMKSDKSTIFDGLWVSPQLINYNFTFGHQIVRKPFKGDNPAHIHNFHEVLAWYGTNPEDPDDFGGEVVFYLGEELEKHVFTKPTVLSLPPGFVHCPMEITRIDRPIIQIEMMMAPADGSQPTREPFFDKDKDFRPDLVMDVTNFSLPKEN